MISVVIPIYNAENTLKRCLDSVLAQSYGNLEILLVDDGSTDSSLQISEVYVQKDARVTVYHQSNQGVAAARNKGIGMATGKYIYFIDPDDYMESDMLQKLMESQSRFAICNYYIETIGHDGMQQKVYSLHPQLYGNVSLDKLCLADTKLLYPLWNKLFVLKIIRDNNICFPSIACWEDACFVWKYMQYIENAVVQSQPLYHYTVDTTKESMSKKLYTKNKYEQYCCVYNAEKEFFCKKNLDSVVSIHSRQVRLLYNLSGDLVSNIHSIVSPLSRKERVEYIRKVSGIPEIKLAITNRKIYKLLEITETKLCVCLLCHFSATFCERVFSFIASFQRRKNKWQKQKK